MNLLISNLTISFNFFLLFFFFFSPPFSSFFSHCRVFLSRHHLGCPEFHLRSWTIISFRFYNFGAFFKKIQNEQNITSCLPFIYVSFIFVLYIRCCSFSHERSLNQNNLINDLFSFFSFTIRPFWFSRYFDWSPKKSQNAGWNMARFCDLFTLFRFTILSEFI